MKEATLSIIEDVKNKKYVMVKNHRGINKGCVNFPGGKREEGETLEECVCRETLEETGLKIQNPVKVGYVEFHPIGIGVHIYKSTVFSGNLKENSEEVDVFWQDTDKVPYEKMRDADRDFIAEVLSGKKVCKRYHYDENFKVCSCENLPD